MIPAYDNIPVNPDGPNMRDYDEVVGTYAIEVPEHFNYGFDVIDRWSEDRGKRALVWADRTGQEIRKYSFFDLKCQSNRFANALLALGLERGDRLFVMVPRVVDWYAVMLGCFKLGVIPMPAPNILTPKDVAYRVNEADAAGAVVWHEHLSPVEARRSVFGPPISVRLRLAGAACRRERIRASRDESQRHVQRHRQGTRQDVLQPELLRGFGRARQLLGGRNARLR